MVRSLWRGILVWADGKYGVRILQGIAVAWMWAAASTAEAFPSFTLQSAVSTTNEYYVAAGDLDGDGDKDIVSTYGGNGTELSWWANNGSGTSWTRNTIQANNFGSGGYSFYCTTVFVFDMDNDGDLDVVGGANNGATGAYSELNWWENNGTGTTWTRRTIDVGTASFSVPTQWVEPADIDADGDIDVAATSGDNLYWYERSGTSFTRHLLGSTDPGTKCAHPVSLNSGGTGAKTIVTCSYYMGRVKLWTTAGTSSVLDSSFGQAWSACSFDFDGDGDKDLVVTSGSASNGVRFWKNNSGTLSLQQTVTGNGGYGLAYGDFDGDGDIDAAGGFDFCWWANNGTGTSWTRTDISNSIGSPAKAVADFDGDGDLDVAATRTSGSVGVGWFKN